jgi:predicted transcriptional regulator
LQGKAYRYAARVPKATLLQATSRALARVFAGGSTKELLLQLVETEDIGAADLELIRAAAAGRTLHPERKKAP